MQPNGTQIYHAKTTIKEVQFKPKTNKLDQGLEGDLLCRRLIISYDLQYICAHFAFDW